MRRRDRHLALVLGGMLLLNIFTALASVSAVYVYRKRFRLLSESSLASCKAAEKSSVEAASIALLLVDMVKDHPADESGEYVRPVVIGYGQTRSRNAIYLYRDIDEGGVVHREFIQRIPILGK